MPLLQLLLATVSGLAVGAAPAAQAQTPTTQPAAPSAYSTPALAPRTPLSGQDAELLRLGLQAARSRDLQLADSYRAQIKDPVAQRLLRWGMVDTMGDRMSFFELDAARRDFAGWPRGDWRQQVAERSLALANLPPDRVIAWFGGEAPTTAEGAMTLASALQAQGKTPEAQALVKDWWRNRLFEAGAQSTMLSRYGTWLTQDDHIKRLDTLLLGPQGPATQAIIALVPADYQTLARARMALRSDAPDANTLFNAVPAPLLADPGLAFERASYLRRKGMETLGFNLVSRFPPAPYDDDGADRLWRERKLYMQSAIRARDYKTAYAAMTNHGFRGGEKLVEAEFFAGWIALRKLNDAAGADKHFSNLQNASSTPITQGRAGYWRGRALEAQNQADAAKAQYQTGARYFTTFYGQLAAEKAGQTSLSLGRDPIPTEADRQRFEGRELIRAARVASEAGEKDLFRVFVMHIDDTLPSTEEAALLVDMARQLGDQDLSMRVVRAAAQKGYILPERGYPMRQVPAVPTSAEPAFVLAITRQESGFDPRVRSSADARGMMQMLPSTARGAARRLGVEWSENMLWDPDYNMKLGAFHLGELVDQFSGSYILAMAAYNAGPNRPPQWIVDCGDPRGGATDPVDFIECIPFSETRNYVMRVSENMQVYRARLNGGTAANFQPSADLKRGGYGGPRPYTSGGYTPGN
ncbi:transglycosylase SLT domain-containing protein [Caulobacter sp. 17J80-11]|nr:transglycosylase SLT domain-containing protein [Caulobacter sp. 17J80-11]